MDRVTNLKRALGRTDPWDIVVIGGGATGVGCAVDAATRGLSVLLLEQHDLGKGTSSRSTKLIHGGVRYLAQGDVLLVRESLRERGLLLKNAPHVVRIQEFVIPCYSRLRQLYYGIGLKAYDLLAGRYAIGSSRFISRDETIERLPNVRSAGLIGGISYFDGEFDDTRLLIDLAMTADEHGAVMLNYSKVTAIDDSAGDSVPTIAFANVLTGEHVSVRARMIINASGAFCDSVRRLADRSAKDILRLSQGIHVVLDRSFLPGDAALMLPQTSDGRVLFAIPWHGYVVIGTTETPIGHAELEPRALEAEIEFVLETAANCLAKRPNRSDVRSVFAGIRPLVNSASASNTAKLSRGHTIERTARRMLTVTGGKWTTYRSMAEDAVDQAVKIAGFAAGNSVTQSLLIRENVELETSSAEAKLHPELPYTETDVVRAVRFEMAQTVEDVLARRTRCLFLNAKAAIEAAPRVAEIMANEIGKDSDWIDDQLADFAATAKGYLIG